MISTKLQILSNALVSAFTVNNEVTLDIFHYFRPQQNPPYCIWAEDSENGVGADNSKAEQAPRGTVDYFTKNEFDGNIDTIQTALDSCAAWYLNSVQYEDDTNLIHYEWVWEVP